MHKEQKKPDEYELQNSDLASEFAIVEKVEEIKETKENKEEKKPAVRSRSGFGFASFIQNYGLSRLPTAVTPWNETMLRILQTLQDAGGDPRYLSDSDDKYCAQFLEKLQKEGKIFNKNDLLADQKQIIGEIISKTQQFYQLDGVQPISKQPESSSTVLRLTSKENIAAVLSKLSSQVDEQKKKYEDQLLDKESKRQANEETRSAELWNYLCSEKEKLEFVKNHLDEIIGSASCSQAKKNDAYRIRARFDDENGKAAKRKCEENKINAKLFTTNDVRTLEQSYANSPAQKNKRELQQEAHAKEVKQKKAELDTKIQKAQELLEGKATLSLHEKINVGSYYGLSDRDANAAVQGKRSQAKAILDEVIESIGYDSSYDAQKDQAQNLLIKHDFGTVGNFGVYEPKRNFFG